jgi:outer membrane protein TolC
VRDKGNPLKIWAWVLMSLTMMAAPALAAAQVSLTTVVDLAQRNSSLVELADADVQKAKSLQAQADDVLMPDVEFGTGLPFLPSVGFTGSPSSVYSISVQSTVFGPSQLKYMRAARAGAQAASLSLKDAREQVALSASTAYIELDTVDRELDAARQQEDFTGRLVSIEEQRTEAGVDPLSDLLQARLTAAQLKLTRLHLETRAATLSKQLATLTGLPEGSITPDHASIPDIPEVKAGDAARTTKSIESAQQLSLSKRLTARGDAIGVFIPQMSFGLLYNRNTTLLNNSDYYYVHPIPANNFSSGFSLQLPLFSPGRHAKARESAAEALRATVEAEQAQRQNEIQVATLTGSLRELDAQAEIASLKQQIAHEQLQTVLAQLELGNGAGSGPGAQPQLTPKAEQLARIDEQQKLEDALDAGFELAKARLSLLCSLGHMEDWLNELHAK